MLQISSFDSTKKAVRMLQNWKGRGKKELNKFIKMKFNDKFESSTKKNDEMKTKLVRPILA